MSRPSQFLEDWYAALNSPYGVVIAVSDPAKAIQRYYQARAKSGDPDLQGLSIRRSPTEPNEIWLVKDTKEPPRGQEEQS